MFLISGKTIVLIVSEPRSHKPAETEYSKLTSSEFRQKFNLNRGKSLSRWVRNRDSWRLPRQIAIFGICRDISRQYTFSAISRDFLWFFTSDGDFIYSLTVKFLEFLPSEADLTSRHKS